MVGLPHRCIGAQRGEQSIDPLIGVFLYTINGIEMTCFVRNDPMIWSLSPKRRNETPPLGPVASTLNVADGAVHWALWDARLVKDVFLTRLKDIPTGRTISELIRVSHPLTFVNASVCAIDPPAGFEALATAMAERYTITIIYKQGLRRAVPRKDYATPRDGCPWCGVCDRTWPSERCGRNVSTE